MRQQLFSTILLVLTAVGVNAQQSDSVRKTIESNNKSFVEFFNRGDAVAIGAMYSSDALLLPPNSPMVSGRASIQGFWQNLIKAGLKAVKLETERVDVCGDTAYEVGYYTLTIPSASGAPSTDQGKYVVVWKHEGRRWRLLRDIWNTSNAAGR